LGVDFVWGGQDTRNQLVFLYGRGNNYQLKLGNNVNGKTYQVNSVTLSMKKQGIKEFTAK